MRTAYLEETNRVALDDVMIPDQRREELQVSADVSGTHKLLVLSVSAGSGHTRAAEALCSQANAGAMGDVARHVDAIDYVWSGMRRVYTDVYLALVARYPRLWAYVYRKTHEARPDDIMEQMRRASEKWSAAGLLDEINRAKPRAIICTHFMPAEILAGMKRQGKLNCPVWVQVTDFDLHRMWVHEGITGYFVGNEEVAFRMRGYGVPADAIHVTGIPISPAFGQQLSRAECAHEIGIDPHRKTLLLMGGGAGLGKLEQVAERLLQSHPDCQLIALAGKNADTLAALKALTVRFPQRLVAQGYTDRIERLMACSDLAITKSGGLTTSECLAMALPMIINQPIPGQEERNADYLLEQGVALKACDADTLDYRVGQLIENPSLLALMRVRASRVSRIHAAREVVKTVLGSNP